MPQFVYAQPNPKSLYPWRIRIINGELKTNPNDCNLIWERLQMQVELLHGSSQRYETPFSNHEEDKISYNDSLIQQMESDFKLVFESRKKCVADLGDFYLSRMFFYDKTKQYANAIYDALYLKDSIKHSPYSKRLEYFNENGENALFGLHVLNGDYENALFLIEKKIEKEMKGSSVHYYSEGHYFIFDKVKLYAKWNKKSEVIDFLKELSKENFNHYFEEVSKGNPNKSKYDQEKYLNRIKEQGFYFLKSLKEYLKEFESEELTKYEKIYNQLEAKDRKSEYEYYINTKILDEELKMIVSEI